MASKIIKPVFPGRVTLKDIALEAGVNVTTVSKVLNSTQAGTRVSEATRRRIQQIAADRNYHPSSIAQSLVRQRTDTIGVLLPPGRSGTADSRPRHRHPFFGILLDAVLDQAAEHDLNTTVFTHKWQSSSQNLARLRSGHCDGFLLFYQPPDSDLISTLLDAGVPAVSVSDQRDDPRLCCVGVENHAAARCMTEYLLSLGHRRIALFSETPRLLYTRERIEGYGEAFQKSGMACDESLIVTDLASWNPTAITQALRVLVVQRALEERPSAIFCTGDELAAATISALGRLGQRVPEDVSVAGFNDDSTADQQHIPLTTMRQPYTQIAGTAIELLMDQAADITRRGRKVTLPAELVVRGSTAPPRR